MMKRVLSAIGILGLGLTLAAGQASAARIYSFSGVTFTGGGTLTGTFTTNDPITALLDYNITTSPAVGLGFTFTPVTAPVNFSSLPSIIVVEDGVPNHILEVTFNGGLTATGAPITIGNFDSFEQGTAGARRTIATGSAVVAPPAVPEPSTLALTSIGVFGFLLHYVRRREQV